MLDRRPGPAPDRPLADDRGHPRPDVAFTSIFDRLVETGLAKVSDDRVDQAIQAIVDGVFGGSRPAFNAALARRGANTVVARAAVADELLRAQIEGSLHGARADRFTIQLFYGMYPDFLIRPFRVTPAAPWLGNRTSGFALAASAPAALFRLPSPSPLRSPPASARTPSRRSTRRSPSAPCPYADAPGPVATTLRSFARTQAYEDGARARAESALNRTICLRDDLPNPALVSYSTYLPFLALSS